LLLDGVEYERWMDAARRTLDSARGDYERGDYNWSCFKSHQAAEMAVKALLYGLGEPRRGHSVLLLLEHLASAGLRVPDGVRECASTLDKHYILSRYPDAWSEGAPHLYYTRSDAAKAIECASTILSWVESVWEYLSRGGGGLGGGS